MACNTAKIQENINNLIDSSIIGNSKSITKNKDRFIITYSKQFQVKTREQAYSMAVQKVNTLNELLSSKGYSPKFGPYVSIDTSFSDRIVIHKNSLDKLINAYELRNRAEEENKSIQDILNEEDNKYAQQRVDNEISQNLGEVVYDMDTNIPTDEYTTILDQRRDLLTYITHRRREEKDLNKKNIYTERINRLREQIKSIENKDIRSFDLIVKYAKSDLEVVSKILENNPTPEHISYSRGLIANYSDYLESTFENIINQLDENELNDFNNLIANLNRTVNKAHDIHIANTAKGIESIQGIKLLNSNDVLLPTADIPYISIFRGSRILGDISQINNPVIQYLSKLIKSKVNTYQLLANKFATKNNELVTKLSKFQKDKGLNKSNVYDYIYQTDENGKETNRYVTRNSDEYYKSRRDSNTNKRDKLEFFVNNHTFKFNKDAWNKRKEDLSHKFDTLEADKVELNDIDIRKGIDIDTKIEFEKAKYIANNSSEGIYSMLIKIQKDNKITNSQVNQFDRWVRNGGLNRVLVNDEYTHVIESESISKWIDPKWQAIQDMNDSDIRKQFYNHFISEIEQGYKRMQSQDEWLDWTYIPEKLKKGSILNQIKDSGVNAISQRISIKKLIKDPITNEYSKEIPKSMLGKTLDSESRSRDLGDILNSFYRESVKFDQYSSIEEDVNSALFLLKNTKAYKTNRKGDIELDSNNKPQFKAESDLYKMAQYHVDAILYNESQAIEGVTNIKLKNTEYRKNEKELNEKLDNLVLTPEEKSEGDKYIVGEKEYLGDNKNIAEYVKLGTELYNLKGSLPVVTGTKIGNTLNAYTGFKLMGFNLYSGIGEMLQGIYSLSLASAGNRWFKSGIATSSMGIVLKSMNPGNNDNKIKNLAKYFQVVSDKVEFADAQKNKLTELGYAQYRAASYLINSTYLVSMLRSKTIKDNIGNEYNLYDVIQIDKYGNFSLPDNFDKNYFINSDNTPSDNLLELMSEYEEMLKYNRERKKSKDPIEADKKFLGRALGQFKSNWMINGFLFRFQDYQQFGDGREMKGIYRSLGSIFNVPTTIDRFGNIVKDSSIKGYSTAALNAFSELMKFTVFGKLFKAKPNEQLSDLDISNLKMLIRELTWGLSLYTTIMILSSMSGGDDDENLPFYKYAINQSSRLLRDITTYGSPSSFISLTKNPMPFMSTVSDIFKLGSKTIQLPLLVSPDFSENEDLHFLKTLENNTPIIRQIRTTFNKTKKVINYTD